MKVKIIREVVTTVEEVMELTCEEYCALRADMTPLKTSISGNISINVKTFEPLTLDDEIKLYDFFEKNKISN